MQLGRITGTVTATVKAERLTGQTLLVVDIIDAAGTVLAAGMVAPDTVGAGVGDTVLLTQGSAARMAQGLSSAPVDLAIVAIVDRISV
ncbi:Ethanolamine utilization protein EutN/carboxysome structural protein Ccml [Sulfitobacter noctilucicola]|uniref:Microcompartment protein CcmK/EutM n=1 Tax=Sulfitobacter noctilucicola TaxID=1342301 RepID=A0A7W6MDB9_9RHOB|nr:EutN/CcmL family microcompartment protein [Sulfitobacter noctilucicola]KIN70229.1 Ethanolamine utilization protein EutN/carboxysome structural protein Ccml [Sulfitobacter noctilucicola]MBB4176132.1 microcompartment protein CcmK/EutM [Sulfitobacter noctilucicola]